MSPLSDVQQAELLIKTVIETLDYFVNATNGDEGLGHLLQCIFTRTESQYGCIGEVLTNGDGMPFFKTLASRDIG